jgi:hypothetical protein
MSAPPPPAISLPPVLASRLQKELQALATQPPPGVTCWPVSETDITFLHATIVAPKGSCYEGGIFTVEVHVPLRYPFEPPKVRFVTPVYDVAARRRLLVLSVDLLRAAASFLQISLIFQIPSKHRRPRSHMPRCSQHVRRSNTNSTLNASATASSRAAI